jgi:predicted ATPase
MLESFSVRNFKSFVDANLELRPLTVLIGANASGKTNLIEALQLLSWMAEGRPLGQLLSAIRDEELSLRGTLPELTWDPSNSTVEFACRVDTKAGEQLNLELSLALDDAAGPSIASETLRIEPKHSSYVMRRPENSAMLHGEFEDSQNELIHLFGSVSQPMFIQLLAAGDIRHPDDQRAVLQRIQTACRELVSDLRHVLVLDSVARRMRGYSHELDRNLRSDGANVSAVLHHLCESGHGEAVLEFVRALPEQDIEELGFIETPRREFMVQLRENFGGQARWREAAVLSDGTLRVLAIAAAVLSVEPGSTVVIEEVDNGVHASRVGRMLELIRREADRRDLRVLVTTHNSAMLDAIPDEELPHVVACYRDPTRGDSRLVELGDLDRFPELVARGPLGQVVSQGLLERFLTQTPEQRRALNRGWLESLRDAEP